MLNASNHSRSFSFLSPFTSTHHQSQNSLLTTLLSSPLFSFPNAALFHFPSSPLYQTKLTPSFCFSLPHGTSFYHPFFTPFIPQLFPFSHPDAPSSHQSSASPPKNANVAPLFSLLLFHTLLSSPILPLRFPSIPRYQ